jgi:hypothetical protein
MTRALEPHEIAALQSYAAEHGRTWKRLLEIDWYNARCGRCADMPNRGAILHGMRNDPNLGPRWLATYRIPK